jgi:hypothetical protein
MPVLKAVILIAGKFDFIFESANNLGSILIPVYSLLSQNCVHLYLKHCCGSWMRDPVHLRCKRCKRSWSATLTLETVETASWFLGGLLYICQIFRIGMVFLRIRRVKSMQIHIVTKKEFSFLHILVFLHLKKMIKKLQVSTVIGCSKLG